MYVLFKLLFYVEIFIFIKVKLIIYAKSRDIDSLMLYFLFSKISVVFIKNISPICISYSDYDFINVI